MVIDFEHCYRAVQSRDVRFDGAFYTAVASTGIYCRPSCPARAPKRENVDFFPSAAAAQAAGFRACKRCRPEAAPGSPEWNVRADVVGRAMRLIQDGVVDRDGVSALAQRLAFSERHLNRQLVAEVGAGAQALARAQRNHSARALLESTRLPVSEVALAAGFSSIRQFNEAFRSAFGATPTEVRRARPAGASAAAAGSIELRLAYRPPGDVEGLLGFLGERAVAGVEEYAGGVYRRTLALPHGEGIVELWPGDGHVRCRLALTDLRDLGAAVQRCRRLLDLDADPLAIAAVLGADPLLRPLVEKAPGRRVPGHVDGAELAVRAVLGQQISVAGARTLAARIVARYGRRLSRPSGSLTHHFPEPTVLAAVDPVELPVPRSRARALRALAQALTGGSLGLDPGADRDDAHARLLELPGIGPWTASYVAMRALGDPDAFLPSDLGVRHAVERLGRAGAPADVERLAECWRPWRAYATQHLWATLSRPASIHLTKMSDKTEETECQP